MRQATALGFKLIAYLVIFGLTMPIFGLLALPQTIILAAVHTLLLWLADQFVLPRFGNMVALVGDVVILIVGSLFVISSFPALTQPLGFLLSVLLGTAFEWWFHRWLLSTAVIE